MSPGDELPAGDAATMAVEPVDATLAAEPVDATMAVEPVAATMAAPAHTRTRTRTRTRGGGEEGRARPRDRGDLVGRYTLLRKLGAGAMGVVWDALDPELDRRVAIKLLVGRDQSERLLREAQALARLAHPNVVAVYDAGEAEGDVWLAMELVEGVTLKEWLARQRPAPTWRTVLETLMPAGAGVAAAHAAGLIHRDLKPDNLMIGDDGRARVMDFGLARAGEALGSADLGPIEGLMVSRSSLLSSEVTRTGAILGTPAYMAPEQLRGRADERSDLFAFCVVLWESLFGARPFGGDTVAATVLAISEGRFQAPPRGRDVPRWLRRVLERGLALRSEDRWPDMAALLAALRGGLARQRRGRWLVAAGVVAGVVAAGLVGAAALREQRVAACAAAGAEIAALWPGRADEVAAGMGASPLSYARSSHAKVVPLLDAWARRWGEERRDACVAETVERSLDAELRARAELCLDLQRASLTTLLDLLAAGNAGAIGQAVPAASSHAQASSCVDRRVLERGTWPPPERRAAVAALRERMARAGGLQIAGDYDRGLADARAIRADAEALGWAPLMVELDLLIGKLLYRKAALAEAEEVYRGAYFSAGRLGADRLAGRAALELTLLVGVERGRPADGLEWGEHAAMVLGRLGDEEGIEAVNLLGYQSLVQKAAGALDKALPLAERAQALNERLFGPDHIEVARSTGHLALILQALGRNAEARALFERNLAIRIAAQGPDHPDITGALNNLGLALKGLGDLEAARATYERAIALHERLGEGDGPWIAKPLTNLMGVYADLHDFPAALRTGERALAIREAQLGPDHPNTAASMNNLGVIYLEHGQPERALELHHKALAIREAKLGPDHPEVARSLTNLAETHIRAGNPALGMPLALRAEAIRVKAKVAPQDLAYTRYVKAMGLAATGAVAEARALAQASAETFRGASDHRVADVEKFLAGLDAAPAPGGAPGKRRR